MYILLMVLYKYLLYIILGIMCGVLEDGMCLLN